MIFSIRRGALVASGVLCLALAGGAFAQPAPPSDQAQPDAGHHPWRDPAARAAERARRLSEVLQLRPDQDGALHAFLDSMKPPVGGGGEQIRHEHEDMEALSTPERLDRMLAHFDQKRAELATRVAATKAFYAQLTPGQQKAFDAMGPGFGHHGHGDGHGRGDEHERGPHGPGGPDGPTDEGPRA